MTNSTTPTAHQFDASFDAMERADDTPSNPRATNAPTIGDIISRRLSRRGLLGGLGATAALGLTGCLPAKDEKAAKAEADAFSFAFKEITRGQDPHHHIPEGYELDVMLRWGDAIFADSPTFDPTNQTLGAQERQFGYNCDFIGFHPLETDAGEPARGLLCVNHEYTASRLMFPGANDRALTREECEIEMAAHGGTIIEIAQQENGHWAPVLGSQYNRRITTHATKMDITGPAAGNARMKTSADPSGAEVIGTVNNCAGGMTPWGTYLMAEENFNSNFLGTLPQGHAEEENHKRYGVPRSYFQWGNHFDRFNVGTEPNEPNRFGWVVEVDILDPTSTPKKRTALGRFKHEGAETVIAPNGKLVIYMGDDQRFDYLYKYVSEKTVDTLNRAANMDLLDSGTLYVARFNEDGTLSWLPLTHGTGPLIAENGFESQGDVLIETRRAADLLGATPMDRPEDVEPDPKTGRVWLMLTNNHKRGEDQINAANPRANNVAGHIIEINEPDGDFTATTSRWDFLIKCGDPSKPEFGATWNPETSEHGWFGSPDNCALDPSGRLWVATDGNEKTGSNDGLWAVETDGPKRGTSRAFFRGPNGAEICGPRFAPDGETLFLAVQHPGDGPGTSYEAPSSRWPDFDDAMPPRPSVVSIRKTGGGPVGS